MLVSSDEPIGFLAYLNKQVVGWVSVSPRKAFVRLDTSRTMRSIDSQPVYAISCFYIHKKFRRMGLSSAILKKVISYYKKSKVKILEAYPVNARNKTMPDAFAWTGLINSYLHAGFTIAATPTKSKSIVRYYLK
jgi:GNAT superfamily N-acetyltransferase